MESGRSPLTRWHPGGSLPLLTALVVLFALESLATGESHLIEIAYGVVLLGSAWAMSRDRRLLMSSFGLLIPAVLARVLYDLSPGQVTLLARQILMVLFLTYSAYFIFRRAVMAPGRLEQDRITGSICVYLLMGTVGAAVATSIESIHPGSFRFPEESAAGAALIPGRTTSAYLYFSFVTLATLGYGDIVPVSSPARTFSWMLAVAGQMYVAIVVARLVSLGITNASAPKKGDGP